MMNNIMLVGRLASEPKIEKTETGKEVTFITLAVNRAFKNAEGIYETDFIDCVLWEGLATNISEYCKKGDVVGVRGRLQTYYKENDDSKTKNYQVVVEKLTFLSSKKSDDNEE